MVTGLGEFTSYLFIVYGGDSTGYDTNGAEVNATTNIARNEPIPWHEEPRWPPRRASLCHADPPVRTPARRGVPAVGPRDVLWTAPTVNLGQWVASTSSIYLTWAKGSSNTIAFNLYGREESSSRRDLNTTLSIILQGTKCTCRVAAPEPRAADGHPASPVAHSP